MHVFFLLFCCSTTLVVFSCSSTSPFVSNHPFFAKVCLPPCDLVNTSLAPVSPASEKTAVGHIRHVGHEHQHGITVHMMNLHIYLFLFAAPQITHQNPISQSWENGGPSCLDEHLISEHSLNVLHRSMDINGICAK